MNDLLEIVADAADDISEPIKKKVNEVINLLIKAVKAKLVYPSSSRLPQQFREEYFDCLISLLDLLETVDYKVESDRILFQNVEVYRAQSKSENFAHVFFRDGIISIQFKRGILLEETESFVDILSRMARVAFADDDLATLLWESDFAHISYKIMDDVLNIETFEYGPESTNKAGQQLPDIPGLYRNEIDLEISEEDLTPSASQSGKKITSPYANVADPVAEFVQKLTVYDDAEKARMGEMLSTDAAFGYIDYIINLLFEILGLETENAGYHEALELIAKVRDDFVKAGNFRSALAIFTRIIEMEQAFRNLKDLKHDKIQGFIEDFGQPHRIKLIIDTLNREKNDEHSDLLAYLNMLPAQAIEPLLAGLGELNHYPARRIVCKALINLGSTRIEILGKGTDDPRWYVVRNVVMILGKIGSPRAIGYFRKTIRHPDLRVRKETLVSAARIASDDANDFLIMALADEDEKLQTMALKELARNKVAKAYSAIEKMVLDKKFKDRPADQIKEFLEALAQIGRQKSYEHLKKMAAQISLMPSEKQKRLRNYAVHALGFIQSQDSLALLEKIARSKNHALADTARRALMKKQ